MIRILGSAATSHGRPVGIVYGTKSRLTCYQLFSTTTTTYRRSAKFFRESLAISIKNWNTLLGAFQDATLAQRTTFEEKSIFRLKARTLRYQLEKSETEVMGLKNQYSIWGALYISLDKWRVEPFDPSFFRKYIRLSTPARLLYVLESSDFQTFCDNNTNKIQCSSKEDIKGALPNIYSVLLKCSRGVDNRPLNLSDLHATPAQNGAVIVLFMYLSAKGYNLHNIDISGVESVQLIEDEIEKEKMAKG